jgi:microcystin-dependent protein
MADAFAGEIRAFTYNFTPMGWLRCDGSEVPIQPYTALFATIGNTYGTPRVSSNFILPDLRGVALVGAGQGPGLGLYQLGSQTYGASSVTINTAQMGVHNHAFQTQPTSAARVVEPSTAALVSHPLWKGGTPTSYFNWVAPSPTVTPVPLAADSLLPAGSGGAHDNCQPYLVFRFCINYDGYFQPRP